MTSGLVLGGLTGLVGFMLIGVVLSTTLAALIAYIEGRDRK